MAAINMTSTSTRRKTSGEIGRVVTVSGQEGHKSESVSQTTGT